MDNLRQLLSVLDKYAQQAGQTVNNLSKPFMWQHGDVNKALSGAPQDVLRDPLVQTILGSMGGVSAPTEWAMDDLARHPADIKDIDTAKNLLDYTARQYGTLPQIQQQVRSFAQSPHSMDEIIQFLQEFN